MLSIGARLGASLFALSIVAVLSPVASASTLELGTASFDGELKLEAAFGERNKVVVASEAGGTAVSFADRKQYLPASLPNDCQSEAVSGPNYRVVCGLDQVDTVIVETGDGRDLVEASLPVGLLGSIDGGDGNDVIDASEFAYGCLISGGPGSDRIEGCAASLVFAGPGNDIFVGRAGTAPDRTVVFGDTGNDKLTGSAGEDEFYGQEGRDKLDGGVGIDLLDGGLGSDTLYARGYSTIEDHLQCGDDPTPSRERDWANLSTLTGPGPADPWYAPLPPGYVRCETARIRNNYF